MSLRPVSNSAATPVVVSEPAATIRSKKADDVYVPVSKPQLEQAAAQRFREAEEANKPSKLVWALRTLTAAAAIGAVASITARLSSWRRSWQLWCRGSSSVPWVPA